MNAKNNKCVILVLAFLIVQSFIFSNFSFAADTILCDLCKKEINGRYYQIKDKAETGSGTYVCQQCYDGTPKCQSCKGLMISAREIGGKKVCDRCFEHYKDSPVCSICKNNILDSYMKYVNPSTNDVNYVCKSCGEKSEKCGICSIPSAALENYEDKRICHACVERLKSAQECNICKKHIASSYRRYDDQKNARVVYICDNCGSTYPKCYVCSVPSASLSDIQQKQVCPACLPNLKKCYGCGMYIFKVSYKYEVMDTVYCSDCQKKTDKCDVCGLPTGANPVVLTDGRKICPDCESTAVKDIGTVRDLYDAVAGFLIDEYRMKIGHINEISFKEVDEMKALGQKTPTAEKGTVPLGIFSRHGEEFDIYVQKNLPKNLLIGVLAHEYAHAYVHDLYPDFEDALINEGFAEWIRHKMHTRIGDEKGAKLIEIRKDLYGDGYKKIEAIEKSEGLNGVFGVFKTAVKTGVK